MKIALSLLVIFCTTLANAEKEETASLESAIEVIEYLLNTDGGILTIDETKENFVTADEIPALFKLLDSTKPCAISLSIFCSKLPKQGNHSTIGKEAAHLIESFRLKRYPAVLSTDGYEPNIEEIEQWYRNWSIPRKIE